MVVAVVPLKNLSQAKSRLAPLLSDLERRGLVVAMLGDVLAALKQAEGVSEIFVVADGQGDRLDGVSLILEVENRGYDEAVATALADPRVAGAEAMLVLPGDLPMARPGDIEAFIGDFSGKNSATGRLASPAVRIAPARDGDGTNALLLAPPGLMASQFGPGSFARHRAAAEALVSTVEIVAPPGLAFDIDTPQDLLDFCARDGDTGTHDFLRRSGVADRLMRAG
ncbi:MAG: 2-phospho-L-lactate guanylyltransferase [Proteobacteria bacterium]|nr:2-phospho-L-lactate guanylyltransferase [Pseudomonadota bacterium]MDA1309209.1 2-phospho-L-lactate guanylyltransferase [Pseudomonadota bacterium]